MRSPQFRSLTSVSNLKRKVLALHDEVADVKGEIDSTRKPTDSPETYLLFLLPPPSLAGLHV